MFATAKIIYNCSQADLLNNDLIRSSLPVLDFSSAMSNSNKAVEKKVYFPAEQFCKKQYKTLAYVVAIINKEK